MGRARELGVLRDFVDSVAAAGGSLLVVGEAGVGKTSLLDAAAAHAARLDTRVLHVSGVEFEAEVSFAGLHQLVAPLAAETGEQMPGPAGDTRFELLKAGRGRLAES
ncbi:AAA family ATPase [Streptomyces sp. NPDC008092]|uniref:AAA family ATPase n=1 Tax=Streptomyces sp. NPDC008092 TaxID=3364808 RepID=UPI0036E2FC5E